MEKCRMKNLLFFLIVLLFSLLFFGCGNSSNRTTDESFRFVTFGDSRVPAYLPYTKAEETMMDKVISTLLIDVFGTDQIPVEKQFNPYTQQIEMIKVGIPDKYQLTFYKCGWPDMIYAFEKGYGVVQMRRSGQQWVYDSVVDAVLNGAQFVLHNGDITFWGYQGVGKDANPYWQDFISRFLSRLPATNPLGLPGRFFSSVGNHETWYDHDIQGFQQVFPYLTQLGFSNENRTYSFDFKNSRFIFLYSGSFADNNQNESNTTWASTQPDFSTQMAWLEERLQDAKARGLRHIFVTYHFPSFTLAEEKPLPLDENNNPHLFLKKYADELDIVVFNGHVHTTELFLADGIRYLNVGGGGGEQEYSVNPSQSPYPELYWKNLPRVEEYNYFEVAVDGPTVRFFVHRFRPDSSAPFETVEVFTGN